MTAGWVLIAAGWALLLAGWATVAWVAIRRPRRARHRLSAAGVLAGSLSVPVILFGAVLVVWGSV